MNAKRTVMPVPALQVDARREARSRRIALVSLGVFAAIVFLVNGIMITTAVKTWTGLAVNGAYERGLTYNQTLEQARAQAALGWKSQIAFERAASPGGMLSFTLQDAAGLPINGAQVEVVLFRPTQEGSDFRAYLSGTGNGVYHTELTFPAAGVWDAYLAARVGNASYERRERLLVQ